MKDEALTGKKILVTAGPTWVAIDRVRVITSIFGGRLGVTIAREAARRGASVVLLLGPGRANTSQLGDYGVRIFHEYSRRPFVNNLSNYQVTRLCWSVFFFST